MAGRFTDEAWAATAELRAAIDTLPFIRELTAGTLARPRFQTYITQDALYLGQFSRALAIAAAKAPDTAALQSFLNWAIGAVAVETELHRTYLSAFGVDPATAETAEPSPDCLAYTSWLLATAHQAPWEVTVAALLPCFWIYRDVGGAISRQTAADNPYRAWIDTYAGEAFGEAVQAMIAMTDRAATPVHRAPMLAAFAQACRYEYLFWDGAYRQRAWPENPNVSIARRGYELFAANDRAAMERLVADDFHFTSPWDNRLDRAAYFARCWRDDNELAGFDFVHLSADGDRVFVTYEGRRKDGRPFRNTEIVTVRDGKLVEVEVYFGWSLPHDAPPGGSRDP